MRRLICTGLVLCLSLVAFAQDAKTVIQQRYAALNASVLKNDYPAIEKWLKTYATTDFMYTSHDKKQYKLKGFIQGMKEMTKQITKVNSSKYKITSWKVTSSKVTADVHTEMEALVSYDENKLRLTDKSDSTDVWVKVGSDWKVKSMTQTKADTQMFQK